MKGGDTVEKNASNTIRRAEHFQVILIGEGIVVGGIAGLVIVLYRMILEYAGLWMNMILNFCGRNPLRIAGWFLILILLAVCVGKLVKYEPMISGSGIPQLEGEMTGKIDQKWWRVLPAKFFGGFLCLLGGMALGREGPSIQLGAMVGKGVSKGLDRGITEEKFLLTCGASAGLSAAFHAPLAGVMFSLEEVHKNFSVSVLVSVMTASLTADFMASTVMGVESVFQFEIVEALPQEYYGMILILGIVLGALGAFYNWFTLKVQSLYRRAKRLSVTQKLMIPFLCAGVLGFTAPRLLGSGHSLLEFLTSEDVLLGTILLIFVGRFLFSAICFGSGAPGGIFFPLLVLGGYIGGAFATIYVQYMGLDMMYINNFVVLAMAGYFAAIVRAPLTGIILIFEMTGSLSQMLSLSIVSVVAYMAATLLKSKPIYESLLERILEQQGEETVVNRGQKVLSNYVVHQGSKLEEALVSEIEWPNNCLLVAIQRGSEEIIPRGRTRLQTGDVLVAMTNEGDMAVVHDEMERLCRQNV